MTMMMNLRISTSGDIGKMVGGDKKRIARAITAGMREAGNQIKQQGRASIAGGGFSGRWQNALRVDVYPKTGVSMHPAISVYHKIAYAGQFEDPQPVAGKPLIWLPIEANLPGGQRWTVAKFVRAGYNLRAGRHGSRPILFGQVAVGTSNKPLKSPHTLKQIRRYNAKVLTRKWLPVFIGVSAVNDPKRFDIGGVVERVGGQLASIFASNWDDS